MKKKKRFIQKYIDKGMNFYSLVFWLCFLIALLTVIKSCNDRFDRIFFPQQQEQTEE